ncbi:MATE family efflux transporter [Halovulum sp. GXIMD14793]
MRATLALGLPLIGVQLAQMSIHVTDTVMIGWLGAEDLAASVLGTQLLFVAFIISSGFANALVPLASTAAAAEDYRGVRRSTRMGFWAVTAMSLAMMPLLWLAEPILLMFGQKPETAALAADYVQIAQWGLWPMVLVSVLRSYMSAMEQARIVLIGILSGVVVNIILNYLLIFGHYGFPKLGIEGAAWASLATNLATLVVLVIYVKLHPILRTHGVFRRVWRPDWTALGEIVRMGALIAMALLAEVGLFAAASIMVGWLGTIPLAAHGIALQIISVIFMVPLGLSSAATVRVGRAVGRRDPVGLDRAGKTVLVLAFGVAFLAALILVLLPTTLIRQFMDETRNVDRQAIISLGVPLLAVAAAFQLVDTLQVVSAALLRGIMDFKVPMIMAAVSYWLIGVPVAYVMAFQLGWGAVGIWTGLAIGLSAAAILLTGRYMMRDRLGLVRLDP